MCWLIRPLSLLLGLRTLASAAGGGAWGWGAPRLGTGRMLLDPSEEQEKLRPTLVWPWWGALGCGPRPALARSLESAGMGFHSGSHVLYSYGSLRFGFPSVVFCVGIRHPSCDPFIPSIRHALMFQCSDLAPAAWGVGVTWNPKDLIVRPVPLEHNGFVTSRFFFFAYWSIEIFCFLLSR